MAEPAARAATRPTAAVLSIGDELALGQTVDTNSAWLSARLTDLGFDLAEHATLPDDRAGLAEAIGRLSARHAAVVATGGLGPTADDLTRFALADAMAEAAPDRPGDAELVTDDEALAAIRAWFAGRETGMPEANAVQARRPAAARCLANPNGTAPGLSAAIGACRLLFLPGPPREMTPMFDAAADGLAAHARAAAGAGAAVVRTRSVLVFGLGESDVAGRLGGLMDRDRAERGLPMIGTTAGRGIVTCRLRATAATPGEAESMLDDAEADVRAAVPEAAVLELAGELNPGRDPAIALPAELLGRLAARGQRLVVAESCTGGLLGQTLTAVPGSSGAFAGGFITYSNDLKSELLGVPPPLIKAEGAVSEAVALEMARGALSRGRAADLTVSHALAITGVAGPEGGGEAKPVGTVWIARASQDYTAAGGVSAAARGFRFRGGREAVRMWSALAAMGALRLHLLGAEMRLLGERPPEPPEPEPADG